MNPKTVAELRRAAWGTAEAWPRSAWACSSRFATAVSGAVEAAKGQVSSAYVALLSADNQVANAREGARIAEGRYEAGLGLFQDIVIAQAQLLTALQDRTTVQSLVNRIGRRSATSR